MLNAITVIRWVIPIIFVEKKYFKASKAQKHVNLISSSKSNIYFKRASIKNIAVKCFVDFGSECTLIKKSLANKISLPITTAERKTELRGFGGGSFIPTLQCQGLLTIERITIDTLMYVVDDEYLFVDLFIWSYFHGKFINFSIQNKKSIIFF